MNDLCSRILAVATLSIAVQTCLIHAQQNTGLGGSLPDPAYTLLSGPPGVTPGPVYVTVPPNPAWLTPTSSNWINPFGDGTFFAPGGVYDYQTIPSTFILTASAAVVGKMAGDNSVCLTANGSPNIKCSGSATVGYTTYTYFAIPAGNLIVGGTGNKVDFKVTNLTLGGFLPTPTGLDVEFLGCPLPGAIYTDGPPNGTVAAWTINFGFSVANSFMLNAPAPVSGFCFYFWVPPGAIPQTVEASVTSNPFGGTTYFDSDITLTCSSFCKSNDHLFGGVCGTTTASYDVFMCISQSTPFNLLAGTYWLNLQNAVSNTGDPVLWDQASGGGCPGSSCPSVPAGATSPESFVIY